MDKSIVRKDSMSFRLQRAIKKLDVFGIPVSLTYKRDPYMKSFIGGLCTLIVRAGVFIYLITQFIEVI